MQPTGSTLAPAGPRRCRFGPLEIEFDERVLNPRPWTLSQSEWAAELAASAPPGPMLELCAGAGQIGLVAARLSGRALIQVEADPIAAQYAAANAERTGLAAAVELRCARLEVALSPDERFPIVLADPPYLLVQVAGPVQAPAVAALAADRFRAESVRVTDAERAVQLLRRR